VVEAERTTYTGPMQISAVKFKATCLKLIDRVAETGEPVIITKRGKVLARLVPDHGKPRGLGKGRGSIEILCSDEELFQLGAGEPWDAGT
jgi:prevent-host-death family protein